MPRYRVDPRYFRDSDHAVDHQMQLGSEGVESAVIGHCNVDCVPCMVCTRCMRTRYDTEYLPPLLTETKHKEFEQ